MKNPMPKLIGRKTALKIRPNTGVPDRYLSSDLILCSGEDARELSKSAQEVVPGEKAAHYHYRCFHFWKYSKFTLALTGIGTGCLEPLIWEMVESGIVRRIILIGTAGYIGTRSDRHGQVYLIHKAYVAGAGIHVRKMTSAIKPEFAGLDKLSIQSLEGIAGDYYYALAKSSDARILRAQASDPVLAEAMRTVRKGDRLVDMETPQFYKLCEIFGDGKLEYAAIRGVANTQGAWDEQTQFAASILTECMRQSIGLLAQ